MSEMLQNSPTSIFSSKNFSVGYTPGPLLKGRGEERTRDERRIGEWRGVEGKGCIKTVGGWTPLTRSDYIMWHITFKTGPATNSKQKVVRN